MLFHRLASIARWLFQRRQIERQLDDELRVYVEMSAADKMRDGCAPEEARRRARMELGGVEQTKERVRSSRHGALLDLVVRDVRYALRLFDAHRAYTATIVLTLGLASARRR